ncbi:MAG: hypothetical protein P1V36_01745 [Planctomycetota bacterium]|nr:hypothetical protein [Planctomycetota bacterium]
MSETIKVRAAVGLYKVGDKWQAVVRGYEVQDTDQSQGVLDDDVVVEVGETAYDLSGESPVECRWVEVEVPLPVKVEKPVITAEVVDD